MLLVTRTFSKIYGMAGLRVGYGVSSPELAEILNRVRQPFNVNTIGICAAVEALKDRKFVAESRDLNFRQMEAFCIGLKQLGLNWIPSGANFVSVDFERNAMPIFHAMLSHGVIVRPIANYGMPNHLRITIGLEEENNKALVVLQKVLEELYDA